MKKNKEIFESLYNQYWKSVYQLAMGYVNDVHWAKDIAQETFVAVWNQLPKFRKEASYSTWIYRIATNICLRQLQRSKKVVANETVLQKSSSVPGHGYQEVIVQPLYDAISQLGEMNRIIISLTLEGVDQKEIASITGLSHANVRTRVYRIKEELIQKLK